MGYRLNRLDEPIFMAVSKPMQTEFGIHHRLESYVACWHLHKRLYQLVAGTNKLSQSSVMRLSTAFLFAKNFCWISHSSRNKQALKGSFQWNRVRNFPQKVCCFLDDLSVMFVEPFLSCHLAMKILRKSCQQCSQSPKSIKVEYYWRYSFRPSFLWFGYCLK